MKEPYTPNAYEKFMSTYLIAICDEDCDLEGGLCPACTQYLQRAGASLQEWIKDRDFE